MKCKHLILTVLLCFVFFRSTFLGALNLTEDYGKHTFILSAMLANGKEDMFCLAKNATARLYPLTGISHNWYFVGVTAADGKLIGFALSAEKEPTGGTARTFLCTKENELAFMNILPTEGIPSNAIFIFEEVKTTTGGIIYKIKAKEAGKYILAEHSGENYEGSLMLGDKQNAAYTIHWNVFAIPFDVKSFYADTKLKGENSITSYTFKFINPETGLAATTSKEFKHSPVGYNIEMKELDNDDQNQLWQFIKIEGFTNKYLIRNAGTGWYFRGISDIRNKKNYVDTYGGAMVTIETHDDNTVAFYYNLYGLKRQFKSDPENHDRIGNAFKLVRFDQKK